MKPTSLGHEPGAANEDPQAAEESRGVGGVRDQATADDGTQGVPQGHAAQDGLPPQEGSTAADVTDPSTTAFRIRLAGKRVFDIVVSVALLIVLALPMLLVAILVAL